MKNIQYKQVDEFPNYIISSDGKCYNMKTKKYIGSTNKRDGYVRVTLHQDDKQETFKLNILVANYFIPKIEGKNIVDHINGIRDDNRVENLRWCTRAENNQFELARQHKSESQKRAQNTPESIQHHKEGARSKMKPIICIETGEIFEGVNEAIRILKLNNLSSHLNHPEKYPSIKGRHYKYLTSFNYEKVKKN